MIGWISGVSVVKEKNRFYDDVRESLRNEFYRIIGCFGERISGVSYLMFEGLENFFLI